MRLGVRRVRVAESCSAMLKLSKPLLPASIADFDSMPFVFNCLNGALDLVTGELHATIRTAR